MTARRPLAEFTAKRLASIPKKTVWTEFTPLAMEHGAVNLGQGFPNFAPEDFVVQEAVNALQAENPLNQQYARAGGNLELVKVVQQRYSRMLNRDIQPTEVQITNGTTQALNLAFQATCNAGDEIIVMEPYFDLYQADIDLQAGLTKYVSLKPQGTRANDWTLDMAELRAAVTPGKTTGILVNTPQNVPGKVWTRAELEQIAAIAEEFDLLVYSDEVYDKLTYDGCAHIPFASLPNMWERTITMASSGKTLTTTGWKIGWAVGPAHLTGAIAQCAAFQTFSVCTPMQIAAAKSLTLAESNGYYDRFGAAYLRRRQMLCDVLTEVGLAPTVPQGSFFVLADTSAIDPSVYVDPNAADDVGLDWHFCRWLTREIGVGAIPVTAFCRKTSRPLYERYARFAFCKTEADIEEAGRRLQKLKAFMKK